MADKYLMIGSIKVERLESGRRLTHPSGVVVIETDEQIAACRTEDTASIADLQVQIASHDALTAKVAKLAELMEQ